MEHTNPPRFHLSTQTTAKTLQKKGGSRAFSREPRSKLLFLALKQSLNLPCCDSKPCAAAHDADELLHQRFGPTPARGVCPVKRIVAQRPAKKTEKKRTNLSLLKKGRKKLPHRNKRTLLGKHMVHEPNDAAAGYLDRKYKTTGLDISAKQQSRPSGVHGVHPSLRET